MTTYFNHLKIEVASYMGGKQPDKATDGAFYKIYSPQSFMIRPREDIYLDLKIKINPPTQLEPWINLLRSLKEHEFKIEEQNWCANKLKEDSIQLNILNRSFTKTTHVKKDKIIAYMFLLGEKANDKTITEYSFI